MSDFNIISAIQKIAGSENDDKVKMLQCSVNSVDIAKRIVNVTTITGTSKITFDAQLQAGIADGIIITPKVGSMVYVLASKYTLPFIIQYSDFVNLTLNGEEFGGLVKVIDLTEKINNLETQINDLKQFFNSWVTVPNDGGAALKLIVSSWANQEITLTAQKEIENTIIKHGG
jgi:hypothetical protein